MIEKITLSEEKNDEYFMREAIALAGRAAELDEKKNALEERLMEIYEELETSEE